MKNRLIFRTEKDQSYFVVANEPFNDERLSWGARGILAYLLSKPDTWQSHQRDLVRQGPDGETRVKKYQQELAKFGYLRRLKKRDKKGKIRWVTELYESPELNSHFIQNLATSGKPPSGKPPSGKPSSGKPSSGKPSSGNPLSGKPPSLVNTEKESTEKENTEKENTDGTDENTRERQPTTKTAAAAAEITGILDFVSGQMPKPLQAQQALLADLQARGETAQSTKEAWEACQTNARKPSGAFVYWLKSGHLPQQTSSFQAKIGEPPPSFAPPPPPTVADKLADKLSKQTWRPGK